MTSLLASAFDEVRNAARKAVSRGKPTSAGILLIDEADAIAQSRELAQMHHEDRAGVNALIRGINDLARDGLPAVVVLCTNRLDAIDPAVQRRSAEPFLFTRPDAAQREAVIRNYTAGTDVTDADITDLVKLTGPSNSTPGFTYSDITQRLIPTAVLNAFPHAPLTGAVLLAAARETRPTPPFRGDQPAVGSARDPRPSPRTP
jgi:AAA+ superfamily predicted ATPase